MWPGVLCVFPSINSKVPGKSYGNCCQQYYNPEIIFAERDNYSPTTGHQEEEEQSTGQRKPSGGGQRVVAKTQDDRRRRRRESWRQGTLGLELSKMDLTLGQMVNIAF